MTPEPETFRTRWLLIGFIILAGVLAGLQVGKVPPAIPILKVELRLSLVEAGWIASLFNLFGACIGLIVGIQADRLGAARVMLTCLIFLGVGSGIGALVTSGEGLLVSRTVESIGFVGITVSGPRLIVSLTSQADHQKALGFWGSYMPAGMALGMFLSPIIILYSGWRDLWLINAVIIFCFCFLFYLQLRTFNLWTIPHNLSTKISFQDIKATILHPGPWLLGLCFSLYTIQWFAVTIWMPTFFIDIIGKDPGIAATLAAVIVAVNIIGNLLAGWLLHLNYPRWLLMFLAFTVMLVSATSVFSGSVANHWVFPLLLLFSALGGMLPAAVLAGAPIHAPSAGQVGMTSGIIVQGANIGSLTGPPLMAFLVLISGWHGTWILITFSSVLGMLLAFCLNNIEKRFAP